MLTFYDVEWEDLKNQGHKRKANVVLEDDYTTFEDIRKIIAVKNVSGDINRVRVLTLEFKGVQ